MLTYLIKFVDVFSSVGVPLRDGSSDRIDSPDFFYVDTSLILSKKPSESVYGL